jgi:hypothetical protein
MTLHPRVDPVITARIRQRTSEFVNAFIVVCVIGGTWHAIVYSELYGVLEGYGLGQGGSLIIYVFGGFAGGIYGVAVVWPLASLLRRHEVNVCCIYLALSLAATSMLTACGLGLAHHWLVPTSSMLEGVFYSLVILLFLGSPILGMAMAVLLVRSRVPATWTPEPWVVCEDCGYDRRGLGSGVPCPECGGGSGVAGTLDA